MLGRWQTAGLTLTSGGSRARHPASSVKSHLPPTSRMNQNTGVKMLAGARLAVVCIARVSALFSREATTRARAVTTKTRLRPFLIFPALCLSSPQRELHLSACPSSSASVHGWIRATDSHARVLEGGSATEILFSTT